MSEHSRPTESKSTAEKAKMSFFDKTIPKNAQEAQRRRHIVFGAIGTIAAVATLNYIHSYGIDSTDPTERRPFQGDTRIVQLDVYDYDLGVGSPKVRTSPEVSPLGLTNQIAELPLGATIKTDDGVEVLCYKGDRYKREYTGKEEQRYWFGVKGTDMTEAITDEATASTVATIGEVYIAGDLVSFTTDGSVSSADKLLAGIECVPRP